MLHRALLIAVLAILVAPTVVAQPPPPRMVMAHQVPQAHVAVLSWTPVHGADLYTVYRGPTRDTLQPIGVTESTYFIDDRAPTTTQVVYAVSAVVGGVESPQSSVGATTSKGGGCYVRTSSAPDVKVDVSGCGIPL